MINANSIRESVARNEACNYMVSVVKYGDHVFPIEESHFFMEEKKALEEAQKITPPPNCYVEVRKKVNEDFMHNSAVVWRSDRTAKTVKEAGGSKGDYGLNPSTTADGPEEKETAKEIKHEAGDTAKLKDEKAPNETGKQNVPPVSKPEANSGEASGTMGKDKLKHEKAPNESKKNEGKVPKSATDDSEPELIKQLTESITDKLKSASKVQLQKIDKFLSGSK
jgi:hypothetical protein